MSDIFGFASQGVLIYAIFRVDTKIGILYSLLYALTLIAGVFQHIQAKRRADKAMEKLFGVDAKRLRGKHDPSKFN